MRRWKAFFLSASPKSKGFYFSFLRGNKISHKPFLEWKSKVKKPKYTYCSAVSSAIFLFCFTITWMSNLFPTYSSQNSGPRGSPMGQVCSSVSQQDETSATGAASSTPHNSQSPGTKSFYPRQGATSKYLIGWKKPGGTVNSVDFGSTRK